MDWMHSRMETALQRRKERGTYRQLLDTTTNTQRSNNSNNHHIDFSSNDYLGLAHSTEQHALVQRCYEHYCQENNNNNSSDNQSGNVGATASERSTDDTCRNNRNGSGVLLGATGSRLLSGNIEYFPRAEERLAAWHNRPAALLCNSGYDANLTVVSSLPCDCILYDEYIHNSLHMGIRLWQSQDENDNSDDTKKKEKKKKKIAAVFAHNSVIELRRRLQEYQDRNVIILVESVYSMDGDIAPLVEILNTAAAANAFVVVDEAHGLGVYGRRQRQRTNGSNADNVVAAVVVGGDNNIEATTKTETIRGTGVLAMYELEHHPALAYSVHTFGKAAGCHGAVICCQEPTAKDYLINYGYPFIYSTALPLHSVITITCAYESMVGGRGDRLRETVFRWVTHFRSSLVPALEKSSVYLLPSTSPIQALMIAGNDRCSAFCQNMFQRSGMRLFPIKFPTVPAGQERVRIILHSHNTQQEVDQLVSSILQTLHDMKLLEIPSRL